MIAAVRGAKAPSTARKKVRKIAGRQFIDDKDQLLDAIIKAVGSLKPGEALEIRKVRDPKRRVSKRAQPLASR